MIKATPPAILFWFSIYSFATGVVGLMCYNCASTKAFSACESDVAELKKGVHSKFAVNCSAYANLTHSYCSIETHRANGVIRTIMRDCNDGASFSFSKQTQPFNKMKFLNPLSNVTICSFYQLTVCVSICQEDMCNGPQDFDAGSSARSILGPITLVALNIVYYVAL